MRPYSPDETRLLLEELDRVHSTDAREAFLFLVTEAKMRPAYDARPGRHGHIYDFRYYLEDKWCYAFIPNQQSLLWYFRRPLLNDYAVDLVALRRDFEEVSINKKEEITVRISDREDALKITGYLV